MNKTYVFTVTNSENADKPIVWCQMATDKDVNVQERAVDLIEAWCNENNVPITESELEDAAYNMRHYGYAWHLECYCFELTLVNG